MNDTSLAKLNTFALIRHSSGKEIAERADDLYENIRYTKSEFRDLGGARRRFTKDRKGRPSRYLVVDLSNEWSILIDDSITSDGCASLLYNLHRKFGMEGLRVCSNSLGTMLTYYGSRGKRVVSAYQENGKWIFFQDGPPAAFEDPSQYRRKRISDRLNAGIVHSYLSRLGVEDIQERLESGVNGWILDELVTDGPSVNPSPSER